MILNKQNLQVAWARAYLHRKVAEGLFEPFDDEFLEDSEAVNLAQYTLEHEKQTEAKN